MSKRKLLDNKKQIEKIEKMIKGKEGKLANDKLRESCPGRRGAARTR